MEVQKMSVMINRMLEAARNYNIWDYGFFKICMICLGIILGAYFAVFFMNHISFIWILFLGSLIWVFYATFLKQNV